MISDLRNLLLMQLSEYKYIYTYFLTLNTFNETYLVVLPQMNLACRQWPLQLLFYLGILRGVIKYLLLK